MASPSRPRPHQRRRGLDVAGYSGTPLPKKLGIKDAHRVAILGPPKDFERTLGVLPSAVSLQIGLAGKLPFDVLVLFVTRRAELARRLASVRRRMTPAAGFWAAVGHPAREQVMSRATSTGAWKGDSRRFCEPVSQGPDCCEEAVLEVSTHVQSIYA